MTAEAQAMPTAPVDQSSELLAARTMAVRGFLKSRIAHAALTLASLCPPPLSPGAWKLVASSMRDACTACQTWHEFLEEVGLDPLAHPLREASDHALVKVVIEGAASREPDRERVAELLREVRLFMNQ